VDLPDYEKNEFTIYERDRHSDGQTDSASPYCVTIVYSEIIFTRGPILQIST